MTQVKKDGLDWLYRAVLLGAVTWNLSTTMDNNKQLAVQVEKFSSNELRISNLEIGLRANASDDKENKKELIAKIESQVSDYFKKNPYLVPDKRSLLFTP